jgi:hypothetical protein
MPAGNQSYRWREYGVSRFKLQGEMTVFLLLFPYIFQYLIKPHRHASGTALRRAAGLRSGGRRGDSGFVACPASHMGGTSWQD